MSQTRDPRHPRMPPRLLADVKIKLRTPKGASVDAKNPRGETALHWASIRGHLRTIHALVEAGADLHAADAKGYSALHHAAQYGQTTAIALLHRRGIQVDIRDNNGRTPLHWAAYKGENMTVQWLVDHGADQSAEDWEKCLHSLGGNQRDEVHSEMPHESRIVRLSRSRGHDWRDARMLAAQKAQKRPPRAEHLFLRQSSGKASKLCEDTGSDGEAICCFAWWAPGPSKCRTFRTSFALTAPIAWYVYMTKIMPVTSHHTLFTILLWVTFWGKWIAWIMLQVRDPAALVNARGTAAKKRRSQGKTYSAVGGGTGDIEMQSTMAHAGRDERVTEPNCPVVDNAGEYRRLYDMVLDKGLLVPVCTTCEIAKPLRSKHDRVTNRCIAKFDHYCPWMNTAIGEGNYREFFFSMFFAMVAMFSWLILTLLYTIEVDRSKSFFRNFWNHIGFELYAWMYTAVALYALLMVSQHTFFILQNVTTNEVINQRRYRYLREGPGGKSLFDRGRLSNIAEFFGILAPTRVKLEDHYKMEFEGGSTKEQLRKTSASIGQSSKSACGRTRKR